MTGPTTWSMSEEEVVGASPAVLLASSTWSCHHLGNPITAKGDVVGPLASEHRVQIETIVVP